MSASEIYSVQLTVVDTGCECFHVLLMRDCLPIIINVLKNWDANKQPLTKHPKSNMLVCAQYDADNLWYRAWIKNITGTKFESSFFLSCRLILVVNIFFRKWISCIFCRFW